MGLQILAVHQSGDAVSSLTTNAANDAWWELADSIYGDNIDEINYLNTANTNDTSDPDYLALNVQTVPTVFLIETFPSTNEREIIVRFEGQVSKDTILAAAYNFLEGNIIDEPGSGGIYHNDGTGNGPGLLNFDVCKYVPEKMQFLCTNNWIWLIGTVYFGNKALNGKNTALNGTLGAICASQFLIGEAGFREHYRLQNK